MHAVQYYVLLINDDVDPSVAFKVNYTYIQDLDLVEFIVFVAESAIQHTYSSSKHISICLINFVLWL